jgi:hypothetical protein
VRQISPNNYLSVSLHALLYFAQEGKFGKTCKNIRHLSLLLSGWSLLGELGNPHWQKKIEIGGKTYHERLRDIFKLKKKKELKISQPLVNNFFRNSFLQDPPKIVTDTDIFIACVCQLITHSPVLIIW